MRLLSCLSVAVLLGGGLILSGCGEQAAPKAGVAQKRRAVPVSANPAPAILVPVLIRSPASVSAFETVVVTARVAGVIEELAVREGATVDLDTDIAIIDADRYRLQADVAAATVRVAEAELAEALAGLERRQNLTKVSSVSAEELSQWQARTAAAEARLVQRQAEFELAELERTYTKVRSLVPGIVQSRLVQTGTRVDVGDPLVTVLQIDPLQIHFSVAIEEASRLAVGMPVHLANIPDITASISFIGAEAQAQTRRVAVIADCAAGAKLRPGMFTEAEITLPGEARPVIPLTAIQSGEDGLTVFILDGVIAHRRQVQLGLRTGDGRVEVVSGLEPDQVVVERGAEALTEGSEVRVIPATASATP